MLDKNVCSSSVNLFFGIFLQIKLESLIIMCEVSQKGNDPSHKYFPGWNINTGTRAPEKTILVS